MEACLPFFRYLLSCYFAGVLLCARLGQISLSLCFSIRFPIASDRSHVDLGLGVSLSLIAEIDMTRHTQQCIEKKEKDDDDNSGGGDGGDGGDEDDDDDYTLYHHKTHACTSRQSRQTRNAREMKKGAEKMRERKEKKSRESNTHTHTDMQRRDEKKAPATTTRKKNIG